MTNSIDQYLAYCFLNLKSTGSDLGRAERKEVFVTAELLFLQAIREELKLR